MTKRNDGEGHDVFISYKRRTAAAEARLIRSDLTQRGIRVFMDVTDLGSGFFDESLLKRIVSTRNFVVILAPHALDQSHEETDWLHREIRQAIQSGCNVVPVTLPEFQFPEALPEDIRPLPRYQSVEYSHVFFDAMMERLLGVLDLPAAQRATASLGRAVGEKSRSARRRWAWWTSAALASLTIALCFTVRYEQARFTNTKVLKDVDALRKDFKLAVNAVSAARPPYIVAAQADVYAIQQLDPDNGTAFYYQGEIKRLNDPALFTDQSCPIAAGVKAQTQGLDAYERDFFHYLNVEANLPDSAKGGSTSYTLCYSRASGYCPQRTAWIEHLLANDLYQEALNAENPADQTNALENALQYEQKAAQLYQDENHNPGFTQCESTKTLIRLIQSRLPATQGTNGK